MYIINELASNSESIGLKYCVIEGEEAREIISKVLTKFKPLKTSGHLCLSNSNGVIPLGDNEFTYTLLMKKQKGYLIFDQEGSDRNLVFEVDNIQKVGELMSESFGIEYFLFDERLNFLIAVNWYVIEVSGDCEELKSLIKK